MKTLIVLAVSLVALPGIARAQYDFQLPRECSERHNVDHSKCVIPDGEPSYPRLRKQQPAKPTVVVPASPAPAPAPAAGVAPRKASR